MLRNLKPKWFNVCQKICQSLGKIDFSVNDLIPSEAPACRRVSVLFGTRGGEAVCSGRCRVKTSGLTRLLASQEVESGSADAVRPPLTLSVQLVQLLAAKWPP